MLHSKKRKTRYFLTALATVFYLVSFAQVEQPEKEDGQVLVMTDPVDLRITNIADATAADLAEWNKVVNKMQGVKGVDPVGAYISGMPGERQGNINNWYPLSYEKQTLCGVLDHFNIFDGSGDEMDWNNFVLPNDEFSFLIEDALPYKGSDGIWGHIGGWIGGSDWHKDRAGNYLIEAEITPDQGLYQNFWFPKVDNPSSVLEGREVCFYGPWVREKVHGNRPEIHPSELIWWKEGNGYWMMAIQDDSNRFDERSDFDLDGFLVPSSWRPWAAPPLTYQFKIAFEVNPAAAGLPLKTYTREVYNRFVVTKDDTHASSDADDGTSHALVYNNQALLVVEEQQENDDDLGVRFVDLRKRSDGTIQGYIQITTKIGGKNIRGDEGFHVLHVPSLRPSSNTTIAPDLPTFTGFNKPEVEQEWDVKSIHPTIVNGTKVLVGNLNLKNVDEVNLSTTQRSSRTTVVKKGRRTIQVNDLPVLAATSIDVMDRSRTKRTLKKDGFALMSFLTAENYSSDFRTDERAWDKMTATFARGNIESPIDFGQSKTSSFTFTPTYSAMRDGKPSPEEGSPVTTYLNNTISQAKGAAIKNLYKENAPFKFSWKFKATNFTSKEAVKVNTITSGRQTKGLNIRFSNNSFQNDGIVISYPDDAIYEVEIELIVSDIFGNKSTNKYVVWSHYLSVKNSPKTIKKLLELASNINGVLNQKTLEGSKKRSPANKRSIEGLESFFVPAMNDGRITIKELQTIIAVCKNLER